MPTLAGRLSGTGEAGAEELMRQRADFHRAPQHPAPAKGGDGDWRVRPGGMYWAKADGGFQDFTRLRRLSFDIREHGLL